MMTYIKTRKQFMTFLMLALLVATGAALQGCGQKVPVEPEGKTVTDSQQY